MHVPLLNAQCNTVIEILSPVACNGFDDCAEPIPDERVDPRLVILARAAARYELVELGELGLDEVFVWLAWSVEPFSLPLPPPQPRPKPKPQPKRAPQVILDALIHELRTHGVARLKDSRCLGRLSDLSTEQLTDLIKRLARLRPSYPAITDKLISELGELV